MRVEFTAAEGVMPDKDLALWLLERMRSSEDFVASLRRARTAGTQDLLDRPEFSAPHLKRLAKLYQAGSEDDVTTTASTAAAIDTVIARDLLSGREQFVELALASYLDQHPELADGLPKDWQTTIEAARAEVEGRTSGAFDADFTSRLAAAAREEMQHENQSRGAEQDRGEQGRG